MKCVKYNDLLWDNDYITTALIKKGKMNMNLLISEGSVNMIESEKHLLRSQILREGSRKIGS